MKFKTYDVILSSVLGAITLIWIVFLVGIVLFLTGCSTTDITSGGKTIDANEVRITVDNFDIDPELHQSRQPFIPEICFIPKKIEGESFSDLIETMYGDNWTIPHTTSQVVTFYLTNIKCCDRIMTYQEYLNRSFTLSSVGGECFIQD